MTAEVELMNTPYYGHNRLVLRKHVRDESMAVRGMLSILVTEYLDYDRFGNDDVLRN